MSEQEKETLKTENQNQELSPEELNEVAGGILPTKTATVTAASLTEKGDLSL